MKIKSLNNQSAIIGATVVYTLLLLLFFGGFAATFNNLLFLIPFFIGLKLMLFLMLRRLRGVIFYTDKFEAGKYGLSDSKMVYKVEDVLLKKVEGNSVRLPKNAFNVYVGEKSIGQFKLDTEKEFEAFQQSTAQAGYNWKQINPDL